MNVFLRGGEGKYKKYRSLQVNPMLVSALGGLFAESIEKRKKHIL